VSTQPIKWKHVSQLEPGDRFELGFVVMEVVTVNAYQVVAKRARNHQIEIVSTDDDRYRMVPE
jgi:hypothetical protein